ncbi:hypothetical protein [Streptomyces tubbatahanensis]|nr:hypothetical protein [Streptomyces tubbatahanensis]
MPQSIPASTPASVPPPDASSTLTELRFVFLATPYVVPPTMPTT